MWLHVLLKCPQPNIHALRVTRHNQAAKTIKQLILSNTKSRCYTLINAGKHLNAPPDNTVPSWLLPCTCDTRRCHCNARFRPDLLCVIGLPHRGTPPQHPNDNIAIQYIEFTYCNDRFPQETITNKTNKYQPLLDSIAARGWKVNPLIVITAGARGTTHTPSMDPLETTFKLTKKQIKGAFQTINTIAIQHAALILLHKRKLENHQTLPTNIEPP